MAIRMDSAESGPRFESSKVNFSAASLMILSQSTVTLTFTCNQFDIIFQQFKKVMSLKLITLGMEHFRADEGSYSNGSDYKISKQ